MDSTMMKGTVRGYFDRAFETRTALEAGTRDWITPNAEHRTLK